MRKPRQRTCESIVWRNLRQMIDGVKEASLKVKNTLPEWKFRDGAMLNVAVADS